MPSSAKAIYEQLTIDGRIEYVVSWSDGRPMQTFVDYPTDEQLDA
jgi:hypothetical protein